uniref:Uncharacterized protein n=1 Tax=Plectus sambesii TaxID=2011161 RepID=A0A914XA00_9BILA
MLVRCFVFCSDSKKQVVKLEILAIPTIASSNSPKVERSKRQALWERGFGDAGYGYSNPWNIGATISNGIGLPFLGPLTGGIFNGMIGRQIGFGTNVWDGTAGGGNMWNVGGLVGGGNRVLVNYPGLSAFSGQQYSQYRYPYFGA